ncbi:MAG: PAS domain-containing sensor histidine kinase, partial [Pedobacter sp.]
RVVGKVKSGNQGKFTSVYAVLMDVSDQKRDEQRKNDFITIVSHELKTPLTSMKGYIQVLQLKAKKDGDSLPEKALSGAERQITKMTDMINGFLNVSRLESGKLLINFERQDLGALVQTEIEEYVTTISSHTIHAHCSPSLMVNADREKLGHVINNLIGNAIKYSSANTNVYIKCFKDLQNAVYSIKDEGMGIGAEDLPRIFERYYRVESSRMATVSGFGVGLYLSAEIIKVHGGKIWAESAPGEGSTFFFSLPLID